MSVSRRTVVALSLAFAAVAASAGAASPVGDFRRLFGEGRAAFDKADYPTAQARFAAADALVPNYPPLILRQAQVAARAGDVTAAIAAFDRYARTGLVTRAWADPLYAKVVADPRFAPVKARLEANAAPVGRVETVFTLAETPFLAESVAWDARRGRWLVSSVRHRKVMQVDAAGRASPFVEAPEGGWGGMFGLALDRGRDTVWAATSALPHTPIAGERPPVMLIPFRLKDGSNPQAYVLEGENRSFGDLAVDGRGGAYVSDSLAGEVWRTGKRDLERVTDGLASPQGIVPTPDRKRLIVADYPGGLQVVDVKTGAVTRLPAPPELVTVWIDGMVRDGDSIVAVQNATSPQRILRLKMDRRWTRVVGWEVLAANLPELKEPTGGTIVGKDFVFVARSQWDAFDDDGKLKVARPEPVLIGRLRLR
jgi:sugar lactone lactonase YvrE